MVVEDLSAFIQACPRGGMGGVGLPQQRLCRHRRMGPIWPVHEKYNGKEYTTRIEAAWDQHRQVGQKGRGGLGQTLTTSGFVIASACKNHQWAK